MKKNVKKNVQNFVKRNKGREADKPFSFPFMQCFESSYLLYNKQTKGEKKYVL